MHGLFNLIKKRTLKKIPEIIISAVNAAALAVYSFFAKNVRDYNLLLISAIGAVL